MRVIPLRHSKPPWPKAPKPAIPHGAMDNWFTPAPPEHIKRERAKAKELRASQWWRQQLGKGVCYHCGRTLSPELLTMDHLIPIVRGGRTTKRNVVVSCKDCNSRKGHSTRAELAMRGEL